ncbi:putative auxin response factor 8-like isoform X1 [Capsicum annuum]|nr:putative auxin response factor 8-like isoform X1 [Capsicum annuum]KAF3642955.1 putative auxin response factor 8-like isoform X1 [Capsicum annuum]
MASSSNFVPIFLLAFSLLAVSVAAGRPCKTLFFISTTSYYPQFPISENPNPTRLRTFFFTSEPTRFGLRFGISRPTIVFRRSDPFMMIRRPDPAVEEEDQRMIMPMEELYSSVTNSIRDRSKDIMRVVGALLFGVGCGALTAATMYLIWSLFWPHRYHDDLDDDDDDAEFDVAAAKKLGYVAIPNKVADDDLKKKPVVAGADGVAPSPPSAK